ncbi:SDR family NAD(P)-dependent oxidoreductase, partial [Bradyrhizobium ottawaense]
AFDKIMGSNVRSNIWLSALAIPQMAERGNGSVIIISSIGGLPPWVGQNPPGMVT